MRIQGFGSRKGRGNRIYDIIMESVSTRVYVGERGESRGETVKGKWGRFRATGRPERKRGIGNRREVGSRVRQGRTKK